MDHETTPSYSRYPWYALRENYASSVAEYGGVPLPLPHRREAVADYLACIDGLVITGGAFDVTPELYGQTTQSDHVTPKAARTAFEFALTEAALARDIPILAICGGQQLLNVVLGGTLIQHIPDAIDNPLAHEQPNPRHEPGHPVTIVAGTGLHRLVQTETMAVNSAHHQAVAEVGRDAVVNARAPDGVIEGIEAPAQRFCIGVQWHPEFLISDGDRQLYRAFTAACRGESGAMAS